MVSSAGAVFALTITLKANRNRNQALRKWREIAGGIRIGRLCQDRSVGGQGWAPDFTQRYRYWAGVETAA